MSFTTSASPSFGFEKTAPSARNLSMMPFYWISQDLRNRYHWVEPQKSIVVELLFATQMSLCKALSLQEAKPDLNPTRARSEAGIVLSKKPKEQGWKDLTDHTISSKCNIWTWNQRPCPCTMPLPLPSYQRGNRLVDDGWVAEPASECVSPKSRDRTVTAAVAHEPHTNHWVNGNKNWPSINHITNLRFNELILIIFHDTVYYRDSPDPIFPCSYFPPILQQKQSWT